MARPNCEVWPWAWGHFFRVVNAVVQAVNTELPQVSVDCPFQLESPSHPLPSTTTAASAPIGRTASDSNPSVLAIAEVKQSRGARVGPERGGAVQWNRSSGVELIRRGLRFRVRSRGTVPRPFLGRKKRKESEASALFTGCQKCHKRPTPVGCPCGPLRGRAGPPGGCTPTVRNSTPPSAPAVTSGPSPVSSSVGFGRSAHSIAGTPNAPAPRGDRANPPGGCTRGTPTTPGGPRTGEPCGPSSACNAAAPGPPRPRGATR